MVRGPRAGCCFFCHHRGHDWFFARRGHRHALRRNAHNRNGFCRRHPWARSTRWSLASCTEAELVHKHASQASSQSALLWLFPRTRHARKGTCAIVLSGGGVLLWRHSPDAGVTPSAAFIRWPSPASVSRPPLVHHLFPAQSRLLPRVHHRAQFQALPHPEFQHIQPFWYYVPVLLIAFAPWTLALLWSTLFGALRAWPQRRPPTPRSWPCAGPLLPRIFLHLQIEAARLHPPAVPPIGLLLSRAYARLVPQEGWTFRLLLLGGAIPMVLVTPVLWSFYFGRSGPTAKAATGAGWVLLLLGLATCSWPPGKGQSKAHSL